MLNSECGSKLWRRREFLNLDRDLDPYQQAYTS